MMNKPQQGQTNKPSRPTVTTPTDVASKASMLLANVANISIPAMITDRLKDIVVTNILRHRRLRKTSTEAKRRGSQQRHANSKKSVLASDKRRERTRSYHRYRLPKRIQMTHHSTTNNKDQKKNMRNRRYMRRPFFLQPLDRSLMMLSQEPSLLKSSSSKQLKRSKSHATSATADISDHSSQFINHYRVSTHIWHAKRMVMHKLTCRTLDGNRGYYLPARHRGRGLKAVLRVVDCHKKEEDEDGQGRVGTNSTKVC